MVVLTIKFKALSLVKIFFLLTGLFLIGCGGGGGGKNYGGSGQESLLLLSLSSFQSFNEVPTANAKIVIYDYISQGDYGEIDEFLQENFYYVANRYKSQNPTPAVDDTFAYELSISATDPHALAAVFVNRSTNEVNSRALTYYPEIQKGREAIAAISKVFSSTSSDRLKSYGASLNGFIHDSSNDIYYKLDSGNRLLYVYFCENNEAYWIVARDDITHNDIKNIFINFLLWQ